MTVRAQTFDKACPLTAQYFSIPMETVLMDELIDMNLYDNFQQDFDIDRLTSFYSNKQAQVPDGASSEESLSIKYKHLLEQRKETADLQEQLLASFAEFINLDQNDSSVSSDILSATF